jgi:hypothetical protein
VPVRAKPGDTVPVDYFIVSVSHGFATQPGEPDPFPPAHMHPTIGQAIDSVSNQDGHTLSFNLLHFIQAGLGIDVAGRDRSELLAALLQLDAGGGGDDTGDSQWVCQHCTFINRGRSGGDCEMCSLPHE